MSTFVQRKIKVIRCVSLGTKTSAFSSASQTLQQSAMEFCRHREFQTTALETTKSLVLSTVLVLWTTSFRVSADLRCRLLATDMRPTHSRRLDTLASTHSGICTRSSLT